MKEQLIGIARTEVNETIIGKIVIEKEIVVITTLGEETILKKEENTTITQGSEEPKWPNVVKKLIQEAKVENYLILMIAKINLMQARKKNIEKAKKVQINLITNKDRRHVPLLKMNQILIVSNNINFKIFSTINYINK